jgi:hypothetical protein
MSVLVDPFRINSTGPWGGKARFRDKPFRQSKPASYNAAVTGVSRDSTGAALGNCTVKLYRAWDDAMIASTVSDGSGNFTLYPPSSGPYYLVAYLDGATDVAGTSVNTLTAV